MIPYRAEFFDRQINYQFFAVIDEPEIKMDYLTLDKTAITLPSLYDISRGWFCQIVHGTDTIFQGVVASVSQARSTTSVQLSPMIALFDTQVYKQKSTYTKTNLEGWMAGILTENFQNSGDSVQNLSGFSVSAPTATNSVALNLETNVHDFWNDIAKKAIENAKVAISCSFNPNAKTVSATVKCHASETEITLEADLPNVVSQNFTLRDGSDSTNKCVIINQADESQRATYTLANYAAPTVCRIETVSVPTGKTFQEVALDKADEMLRKTDFDNFIELQYRAEDPMVPAIKIGQPVRILKNGKEYHTVLTGYCERSGFRTLTFGGIRIDLTKIMKLKGAI